MSRDFDAPALLTVANGSDVEIEGNLYAGMAYTGVAADHVVNVTQANPNGEQTKLSVAGHLDVGVSSNAELKITGTQALVESDGGRIGGTAAPGGPVGKAVVTIDKGRWDSLSKVIVDNGGTLIRQNDGVGPPVDVKKGGKLKGKDVNGGKINGDVTTFDREAWILAGLDTDPIGKFAIGGVFDSTAGVTYFADIGGTGAGQHDILDVTGNAMLGGALDVDLLNGFTFDTPYDLGASWADNMAQGAQAVEVLTAGQGVSGVFEDFNPPPVEPPPDTTWHVEYGDLDEDGDDGVWVMLINADTPIAVADQYSVPHNSVGAENSIDTFAGPDLGVLANDYDPANPGSTEDLRATLVGNVTNGTLDFYDDGNFTYTPDAGFAGTDYFSYKIHNVNDPLDESYSATVTIDVTNNPPLAGDDSYLIDHDTVLDQSAPGVLANDLDDDPNDTLSAVLLDDVDNGLRLVRRRHAGEQRGVPLQFIHAAV